MKNQKLLEEVSIQIFSKDGSYSPICFSRITKNDLNDIYLPCHLRDNDWLIKLFQSNKKLRNISYAEVKKFISSSFFQEMRHEYELKIVFWQINYMLTNKGGFIFKENNSSFLEDLINCDLIFRERVILILNAIGIDQEVIEEGLEKTRNYWLRPLMKKAFYNENNLRYCLVENIEDCQEEYEDAWFQLREYEYYQQHKDIVDKYGIILPSMQMNLSEVQKLQEIREKEYQKRQEYLKQIQESQANGQKKEFILDTTFYQNYEDIPKEKLKLPNRILKRGQKIFKKYLN